MPAPTDITVKSTTPDSVTLNYEGFDLPLTVAEARRLRDQLSTVLALIGQFERGVKKGSHARN